MPSRIQRELAFLLTGRDVSASRAMDNLNRKISGTQRHAGKAFSNIGRNMERGILIGAGAAAGAIGYSITKAIDWESAFAGVRKTVEGTPAQLEEIAEGLRAMSREMPVTAVELAAIAENAGALGIARDDILEFTRTVAMIGATTDVSTDQASTALGQLQNVLGLTGDEFDNFAAALVDLGNKGASTEAQILEIARRSGGAAALLEMGKDETLAWASAAANLGMNQEVAGTSLQRFYQQTLTAVTDGKGALDKLSETAGMSAAAFKKAFGKDASGALSKFVKGLGKLPKEERLKVVQSVFGKGTGLTRLIIGLADSFDRNLNPSLDTSAEAWERSEAAQAEYEKRVATTQSQLAIFKNNIDDAAVTIGANLLPTLVELSQEGVAWIEDHQPEIQQFGKDLAKGVREAVDYLKSLDWDAIGDALRAGVDAAKALVDAFNGLPPEVKQLLVGGFVANKLTGGVGTDIAGGVASGLFKGLALKTLGVQAGIVNVNGPVGGGGAGGTAGGKAGRAGSVLGMAAKVTLVGIAAGVALELAGALGQQSTEVQAQGAKVLNDARTSKLSIPELEAAIRSIDETVRNDLGAQIALAVTEPFNHGASNIQATYDSLKAQLATAQQEQGASDERIGGRIDSMNAATSSGLTTVSDRQSETLGATRDMSARTQQGLAGTALAATGAGVLSASASTAGASRIIGAIAANRPIVNVTVVNNVTATEVTQSQTTQTRYGNQSSRQQDERRE